MKTKIHKFKKIQDKLMAKKLGFILAMVPVLALGQSQDQNYIKQTTYKQANQNQVANPDIDVATIQVNYYNGLGYPIQQISHKQSGTGKDIITYITYDEFGRQTKEFLPYVSQAASLDFDLSSDINQANYYSSNPDPGFETTDYPFSEKTFDDSPLNRLLKQAAPGEIWKKDNGHEVQFAYDLNSTSDEVFQFEVNRSYVSSTELYAYSLNCIGYYAPGTLYKNITKNENWTSGVNNTIEEYIDDLGRVILKRTYNNGQKYDTNYVYDKIGNLIYVIPPLASDTVANVTVTQDPVTYYSQSYYISEFLIDTNGDPVTSGGGSMGLIIENNTIRLEFSGGFSSATFDLTKQLEINAPEPIPDMTLGYVDFYYNGNHQFIVQIQNNKLFFEDYTPNDPTLYFTQLPGISQNLTQPISINLGYETIYTPSTDSTVLDPLCYQYKYDDRNRMAEKKLPGKQWEFIIYDKLDRPVATGPAFTPYGGTDIGWLITEYDVFGRVAKTGWKQMTVDANNRYTNQSSINSSGTPFTLSQSEVLTENYYDDYTFAGAPTLPNDVEGQTLATNVKGLPTGTWVRVLDTPGSSTAETSYTLYDDRYRPVRTYTTNLLGGYTQVDTKLDWAGKVDYTLTTHQYNSGATPVTVKDMYTYTYQDRLLLHKQQINQLPEQLISKNTYDELGQLVSKKVGGDDVITGTASLQKIDYAYNVRGWLKSINDINDLATENDLFAFKINYNDFTSSGTNDTAPNALYNGNISATYWRTANDNVLRKYNYSYDELNRLTNADYLKPEATSSVNSYWENMTYDKNGNIQTLKRNGDLDADNFAIEVDDLTYTYHNQNKNQLVKVFDASNHPFGLKDDSDGINDTDDDFTYDANGNMTSDANKGITNITYNHLNLPVEITFGTSAKIGYLYSAAGQKVQKHVISFVSYLNTATDYLQGFQYTGAKLSFFPHAEGYVNVTQPTKSGANAYNYVFNYTDHLGNIRLSYAKGAGTVPVIMEENHYYPFGLKHTKYNSDTYDFIVTNSQSGDGYYVGIDPVAAGSRKLYQMKYNGKEYQDELGLNWYDYGARNYDSALGRWMNIDPLAEQSRKWTPYNYAMDNPIYFIDPDGMAVEEYSWGTRYTGEEAQSFFGQLQASISSSNETPKRGNDEEEEEQGDPKNLKSVDKTGEKVLEAKKTFFGKLWGSLQKREWTDPETGLVYQVNADGTISGLRPLYGLGVLGYANVGASSIKLLSLVKGDSKLFKLAQETFNGNKTLTREANSLIEQLSKGNMNPGIGTKNIFKNIFEARSSGGARVYFRKIGDTVEILAYSNKANQQTVINQLMKIWK